MGQDAAARARSCSLSLLPAKSKDKVEPEPEQQPREEHADIGLEVQWGVDEALCRWRACTVDTLSGP